MDQFEKYITMPLETAKAELEELGYTVKTQKCSQPKIKTDSKLVIHARKTGNEVLLIYGDFLVKELK